jgi:RNA polymerase sigma-70 factor (ECF subfamily)
MLALMLLQESRRAARSSPDGELVRPADQGPLVWNREQITEGAWRSSRRALVPAASGRYHHPGRILPP